MANLKSNKKVEEAIKKGKLIPFRKLLEKDIAEGKFTLKHYKEIYKQEMEDNNRLQRERSARIVRKARLNAQITQDELAKRLHTSKSFISEIENGRQNISLEYASKIAKALNKEFVWMFK